MPRLISNPVEVMARIGQIKTEGRGMPAEPAEFARTGESCIQSEVLRRAQVEGAAGVMFAAAGRGDELQDSANGLTGGKFPADDCGLSCNAAETGKREQVHFSAGGGDPHG